MSEFEWCLLEIWKEMWKQKINLAVSIYRIILLNVLFNDAVSCSVYITLTVYGALMDSN